jgi:hypothetical protein
MGGVGDLEATLERGEEGDDVLELMASSVSGKKRELGRMSDRGKQSWGFQVMVVAVESGVACCDERVRGGRGDCN